MTWHLTEDVDEFVGTAGDFLRSRPVEHTLHLTIADTLRERGGRAYGAGPAIFGWWQPAGEPVSAALLRTPPYPLLFTGMPTAARAGAAELVLKHRPPAVNAVAADAAAIAAAWRDGTGGVATVRGGYRLYRLDALTPPPPPAGTARAAVERDRAQLAAWLTAFHTEVGEPGRDPDDIIDDMLAHDGFLLWEVDGKPVAMAGATANNQAMVRVMAVYTPPPLRGRGYAGAATTAVSRRALAAGAAHVVLFADLANATSNGLYQRLGYRSVVDRAVVECAP